MNLKKDIKRDITIIAVNKGIEQQELIETYLLLGIEKDKEYLKSHLKEQ